MTEISLNEFNRRWEVIAEIEKKERRNTSLAMRWQQLNLLYGMGKALNILNFENAEDNIVRDIWLKLKEQYE